MASKMCKRRDLSLSQWTEIVKLLKEKKLSQVELAKCFDCSQSTISKIAKNKPAILQPFQSQSKCGCNVLSLDHLSFFSDSDRVSGPRDSGSWSTSGDYYR